METASAAGGAPSFTSFLAAASASVFSFVYLWKIKPDLQDQGVPCSQHAVAATLDWILLGLLLITTLILAICCFDKSSRTVCMKASLALVIPLAFCIASTKAAALSFLYPAWCTVFELLWCLNFGVLMATRHLEYLEDRRLRTLRGTSLPQAEAEVARTMTELSKVAPTRVGRDAYPELEDGCGAEQCAICLVEWDSEDDVRTTPCHHVYHEQCLRTWLTRQMCSIGKQTCAVCRSDLRAAVACPPA